MKQRDTSNAGWSNPYPTPSQIPQQQPLPQPTPGKQHRRHPVLSHAAVAVVALGIGAAIGSSGHSTDTTVAGKAGSAATSQTAAPATSTGVTTPSASTTATSPKTSAAAAAPVTSASTVPTTVSGDGEYLVGTDMQPGTYRTAGPSDGSLGMCYWERDKNASGDFDAIIANDNLTGSGLVTVQRGEYFKTTGCQNWVRVS